MHYEVVVTSESNVNKLSGIEDDGGNHVRTFLPLRLLDSTPVNTIVNVKAEIAHMGKLLTKTSANGNQYASQVIIRTDGAKNKVYFNYKITY